MFFSVFFVIYASFVDCIVCIVCDVGVCFIVCFVLSLFMLLLLLPRGSLTILLRATSPVFTQVIVIVMAVSVGVITHNSTEQTRRVDP